MKFEQKVALWDAINRVVAASGGDPGNTSVARQKAVVEVESVVARIASVGSTPEERAIANCKAKGKCQYCDRIRARRAAKERQ